MRTAALVLVVLGTGAPVWAQAFAHAKNSAADYTRADFQPSVSCESLTRLEIGDVIQLNARAMPAAGGAPPHCRISGVISPEIAFEVNLPARWNGRFFMFGNGGHAGEAADDPFRAAQRTEALRHGFVVASTNTGHDARKEPGASFAISNPQKAIDYAYRAVHLTVTTAKSIAREYFARPVSFSYWNSCSNGGRQGLIEAQRFPEDFDGIVADAPWVDQTGFTIGALWNHRAVSEAPLPPAKLPLLAKSVLNKCDAVDGLTDGLIDDPRACSFDPAKDVASCRAGADTPDCLTPAQASTVAKIYGGVVSNGKPFFPGFMLGSEAIGVGFDGKEASGWLNMIVPAQPGALTADFGLGDQTMKYLVFDPPRPDYDFRTFDFNRDTAQLTRWGALVNASNPDLAAFRKRGGKLLMTYGWADQILQPMMGVNFYERAVSTNGPSTADFFRLFMIPGMAHCAGGPGPDRYDAVTAVIDWVEKNKAPDSMVASKLTNNTVVRTRPLCPYPEVARYTGKGSIDDATNFRCVAAP
jgi:hypothetical protein